LDFDRDNEDE
jgi:hypothetical protein